MGDRRRPVCVPLSEADMTRVMRAAAQFQYLFGERPARIRFLPDGALGCYDRRGNVRCVEQAATCMR